MRSRRKIHWIVGGLVLLSIAGLFALTMSYDTTQEFQLLDGSKIRLEGASAGEFPFTEKSFIPIFLQRRMPNSGWKAFGIHIHKPHQFYMPKGTLSFWISIWKTTNNAETLRKEIHSSTAAFDSNGNRSRAVDVIEVPSLTNAANFVITFLPMDADAKEISLIINTNANSIKRDHPLHFQVANPSLTDSQW